MILILVLLPACAAVVAWLIRADAPRRVLLVAVSAIHAGLVCWLWIDPARFPPVGAWLAVDGLGLVFLGITSILFLAVSLSVVGFLRGKAARRARTPRKASSSTTLPRPCLQRVFWGFSPR